ncbi:MAG: Lrp/AsnC ligand binding domain-containing protein, partial [Candidatus Thorarchaeota archaeon]
MPVRIFLAINVKEGRAKQVQSNLKKFDWVTLACSVSNGPYDVVAFVEVPSLEEYKEFSVDKVSTLQYVTDYTSFITIEQ